MSTPSELGTRADVFDGDVAIIGMSGRFPGADGPDALWENIVRGIESISRFTEEESRAAGTAAELVADTRHVRAAGTVRDVELFDAPFFGMSGAEATVTDPQHRLFLECGWEAMERAGYAPDGSAGVVGLFAGCGANQYQAWVRAEGTAARGVGSFQTAVGTAAYALATRTSYKLDLRGPSVTVQTACSTSLVAVHLACQSLLNGECEIALAGGVTIDLNPAAGYVHEDGGVLSSDGRCRAFDADASGTVGGSGAGVVVLKRLGAALADGDPVLAVIRGSAVNNDGASKVSYTAPSVDGQARVIAEALAVAGVDPATVTYLEAHGTATPLGDPIEIAALTRAFGGETRDGAFCAVGALKTAVGHLDTAAGVAGLIKTVLALRHRTLPPTVHFRVPNPRIEWLRSPFYVNAEPHPWVGRGAPLRAGVSSFGIGGTNAHVVLEEAPAREPSGPARADQLLVLSARTETALERTRERLAEHLRHTDVPIADVAHTLQVGRKAFAHRLAVVCRDRTDAVTALEQGAEPARLRRGTVSDAGSAVAFLFPGHGMQHAGMGMGLYRSESVFRAEIDRCAALLGPHVDADLRTILYLADAASPEAASRLTRMCWSQPAVFATTWALAKLWMSWGVQPDAMLGHSGGEYVAACLAGVFSLEDALWLVTVRGRLMDACPDGAMLAVPLPEGEAVALLGRSLSLAAVNAPELCVLSGPTEAVDALERQLKGDGVDVRRLHIARAAHSSVMDSAMGPFRDAVRGVTMRPPRLPIVSSLTGTWIEEAQAMSPEYWADHLRGTVRFSAGVTALLAEPRRMLLEVGPGTALTSLIRRHPGGAGARRAVSSMRHPSEEIGDAEQLLRAVGEVWLAGGSVDWAALRHGERRHRVVLPTYPFERKSYLVARPSARRALAVQATKEPDVGQWVYAPSWRRVPLRTRPAGAARRWLVLADAGGFGARIAERLSAGGDRVILALAGDHFGRLDDGCFVVPVTDPSALALLVRALADDGGLPGDVVHCWGLDRAEGESDGERFEAAQPASFYSALRMADALAAEEGGATSRLWLVTAGVHEVTGDEELLAERATVLGASRVVPLEYGIACHQIDLAVASTGSVHAVLAELRDGDASSVALRGGYRWVADYELVPLSPARGIAPLREGGVYLVTGGLGMIGRAVAEHLAAEVRARLVLVSRSGLPPREQWDAALSAEPDSETGERIRSVRRMEAAGGEVWLAAADVADARAMRALVDAVRARWGEVHGAIHAAAVVDVGAFTPVRATHATEAGRHFLPKVHGLLALRDALRGTARDFCLLFSSLSTVLGGFHGAAYVAANAYLDAFAHGASRGDERWTSVCWDRWLRIDGSTIIPVPDRFTLTQSEGIDVIRRVLAGFGGPQAIVTTGGLTDRIRHSARGGTAHGAPAASDTTPSGGGNASASIAAAAPGSGYTAPRDELEELVAGLWRDALGAERVGVHDDFFELGGHSLLAIRILSRLREALGVELRLDVIFRAPSVARLSAEVARLLMAEIDAPDDVVTAGAGAAPGVWPAVSGDTDTERVPVLHSGG